MPPKNLTNSKRTRPRAPGVKAGLDLMVQLGGIQVLGTSQQPYYYFPPATRLARGVERCARCVTACGTNAACNVQPYIRVGSNLWKSRKCHYCTIFPAELEGDRCTLEGRYYRFNHNERRLIPAKETGELLPVEPSFEKVHIYCNVHSGDSGAVTPSPEKEAVVPVPEPVTPPTAALSSFGLYTPVGTPGQEKSETKSCKPPFKPAPQVIEKIEKNATPLSPTTAISTISPPAAVAAAASPATETVVPSPAPPLATATPSTLPCSPVSAKPNHRPVALAPVWTNKPGFDQEALPTPSLANFISSTGSATSTPSGTPSASFSSTVPAALPVPVETQYSRPETAVTTRSSVFALDPVSQLVATRRPSTVLSAVSEALQTELATLDDITASIAELRRLLSLKEAEQVAQMRKVDSYRSAIDDALTAIDEEQNALRSMRARLANALL